MVKQLIFASGHVQPIGRPCCTWMHSAMRDVKSMATWDDKWVTVAYKSIMELAERCHEQTYLGRNC